MAFQKGGGFAPPTGGDDSGSNAPPAFAKKKKFGGARGFAKKERAPIQSRMGGVKNMRGGR